SNGPSGSVGFNCLDSHPNPDSSSNAYAHTNSNSHTHPYPGAADLWKGRESVVRQEYDPSEPFSSTRPDGQTSVKAFVQGFWNHHESNDPNPWASDFASRAKYCYSSGGQWTSQRFIGHDRAELITRSPTRQYRFYGLTIE